MPGHRRILPVPYFAQPTSITCQSTCLKMFASYIESNVLMQSTGAGERDILDIWKDINRDPKRPLKIRNAHGNMKWWLEKYFPRLRFSYTTLHDETQASAAIVRFIDGGFPVMVSVSHARVAGHIILVVGYEGYLPNASSPDFHLVVHDPYGKFDPTLTSRIFGRRRFEGGSSLVAGGQIGPGQSNRVPVGSAGRQRAGDKRRGTFYLISAQR